MNEQAFDPRQPFSVDCEMLIGNNQNFVFPLSKTVTCTWDCTSCVACVLVWDVSGD